MQAGNPRIWFWMLGVATAAVGPRAWAQEQVPPPDSTAKPQAPSPAQPEPLPPSPTVPAARITSLRVREDTTQVSFTDNRGKRVAVRVPLSLHRPANQFRLYGFRPLTLWDRDRRRDLYRDACLEIATQARVAPGVNAWAPLLRQLDWLGKSTGSALFGSGALVPGMPTPSAETTDPARRLQEMAQKAAKSPDFPNVAAITGALGAVAGVDALPEVAQPIAATLQLRALATDAALRRLELLGRALKLEAPGTDPALRDGYRAARADFDEVRQGLWPALAGTLRKNQGQLVLSSVKQVVLSRIGFWAIFGYMGWQSVEGALNVEYHGQYAICLATLGYELDNAPIHLFTGGCTDPLALYSEFVLNYELTEALKTGGVMPLQPAGGRSTGEWQIRFSARCDELKRALASG